MSHCQLPQAVHLTDAKTFFWSFLAACAAGSYLLGGSATC